MSAPGGARGVRRAGHRLVVAPARSSSTRVPRRARCETPR
ncbi:hypothetical protein DB32_003447 [Sandaracinus amylolyticus]|uniref:Uncharacterized protein n=1 Tax=Sandaracinus amylolyticus TaxID=927083 RepID=A0A0F6W391_9BACT|nr:hypothetical protein DB32_003447 [Sandaracinus amylolyticus]